MSDKITMGLVNRPNRISSRPIANEYFIRIWGDIEEPDAFSDELDVINSAQCGDVIVLDICTDGGSGDTAALFARSLAACEAHTVCIIGPTCASAGSIIALSCREWILDDTSSLMIHTASYGLVGKEVDIMEHAVFSRKHLQALFNKVYSGFLTVDEMSDVIKGTPLYFLAEEIADRLEKLAVFREGVEEEVMVDIKVEKPSTVKPKKIKKVKPVKED